MGRQLEFFLSYYICIQPNTPLSFLLPYHHRLNTPPTIFIFSLLLKSHPFRFSLPTIPKFHFASIFSPQILVKTELDQCLLASFHLHSFSGGFSSISGENRCGRQLEVGLTVSFGSSSHFPFSNFVSSPPLFLLVSVMNPNFNGRFPANGAAAGGG